MKNFFLSWVFCIFASIKQYKELRMKTVKKTRTRWSREDDELLIALINKGQCAKEISGVLKRTRCSVWSRKHHLAQENPDLKANRIKPAKGDLREVRTIPGAIIQISDPFSTTVHIPANLIPGFIGPKGSRIIEIQEKLGVKMRIQENNSILIRGNSQGEVEKAAVYLRNLIAEPRIGSTLVGKVISIVKYGAFISLNPLYQGLCHASEIVGHPIDNVEDYLSVGQEVRVKILGKPNGKYSLSISQAENVPEIVQVLTPREITQEMTKLARQLARSNGQRMVLAVYFVEGNQC